jgi:plasmid stabilization system protein ParE
MAYKIVQSKLFLTKATHLLEYLEKTWGKKVAQEFKQKLDAQILSLLEYPDKGKNCKLPDVKRVLITPHNKLFYRIKGENIYIISLFDMRQHPKKNKYE